VDFKRGQQDIKKAIGIGLSSDPEPGRAFHVRFKLRESTAEFYRLQKMEREGKPVIAMCIDTYNITYDPYTFKPFKSVICEIEGVKSQLRAFWNEDEKYWEISK